MKRDMDLIRNILLKAEAIPAGEYVDWTIEDFPGHQFNDVYFHVDLLMKDGFMEEIQQTMGLDDVTPGHLTWAGHDFLDAIRDDGIWKQTKETTKHAGGFTLEIVKQVAVALIKAQIKQHTGMDI